MKTYGLSDKSEQKYRERVLKNFDSLKTGKEKYCDPDIGIVEDIIVNETTFHMAPDGICNLKYLEANYKKANLAEVYLLIRRKLILWPKHRQSINQRRYACFRDRIDFTIFDIKQFYESGSTEPKLVKRNSPSAEYLMLLGSFEAFIKEYELGKFVDRKGNVKNLSTGGMITSYDDYKYSDEENKNYLMALIELLKEHH